MIVCLDFRSLYPLMMIGGNLYSKAVGNEDYWQGSGIYASVYQNTHEGIKGKYSRHQGKVEKILYELLKKRLAVKDDKYKSLAIKILINTMYGILGSPKFKSIHSIQAAADCTAMARRSILHARTILEEYGYECLYTDTDSVYIKDPTNNLDKLKQVIEYIKEQQRKSMNLPCDLHDLKIECIIKRMYFFRDDTGVFVKKHYMYVDENDKLTVKGLKVIRGDCSKIAKEFFEQVIKQKVLRNKSIFFSPEDLLEELKLFALGKEDLLQKRYRVDVPESYKIQEGKDEATCIHYQIAKKYGGGEHWLVINKRIGAGKGNKYATLKDLKEKYGEHWIDQVCFEEYMKDLNEFIFYNERNKIRKSDRKRIINEN